MFGLFKVTVRKWPRGYRIDSSWTQVWSLSSEAWAVDKILETSVRNAMVI